jgi:hypothetical protein
VASVEVLDLRIVLGGVIDCFRSLKFIRDRVLGRIGSDSRFFIQLFAFELLERAFGTVVVSCIRRTDLGLVSDTSPLDFYLSLGSGVVLFNLSRRLPGLTDFFDGTISSLRSLSPFALYRMVSR